MKPIEMTTPATMRRLPCGKYTRSAERYLREWRRLHLALEKALGVRVIAYDPCFLVDNSPKGSGFTEIPPWMAQRIVAMTKIAEGSR